VVTGRWLAVAALSMALAVGLGALSAHAFELQGSFRKIFETAHRYHVWHSLALIPLALIDRPDPELVWGRRLLFGGMALFSGSLYMLLWSGSGLWGRVTPFGGVVMVLGWLLVAHYGWRNR